MSSLGTLAGRTIATQSEAEAGTNNTNTMTPLQVQNALDANRPRRHGVMNIHNNATLMTINAVSTGELNNIHGVRLFNSSKLLGFTFDAGHDDVAITAIAQNGSDITVSAAGHSVVVGDIACITATADANYDQPHVVTAISAGVSFDVTATFGATATGFVHVPSSLIPDTAGDYSIAFGSSVSSDATNKTYEYHIWSGVTRLDVTSTKRFFTTNDIGVLGGADIAAVSTIADVMWVGVANLSDDTDLTHNHAHLNVLMV